MTRQQKVLLRAPPVNRRGERRHVGEVAGNATAECAAVCCCVPCTVMDMVVLAAYKVPAGLVKKVMHKRKRRLQQKKKKREDTLLGYRFNSMDIPGPKLVEEVSKEVSDDKLEASRLEEEMWAQFNGTGFWRSASQRHHEHQPEAKLDRCMRLSSVLNITVWNLSSYHEKRVEDLDRAKVRLADSGVGYLGFFQKVKHKGEGNHLCLHPPTLSPYHTTPHRTREKKTYLSLSL
ncbi:hypothetical protein VNO77_28676 [Canavalia gladiata]|uniref:Uncharacterized protein n=1 Tax=Canavalia gladiata TaxID=3824 RepID=A0AAN9KYK9_CANGL